MCVVELKEQVRLAELKVAEMTAADSSDAKLKALVEKVSNYDRVKDELDRWVVRLCVLLCVCTCAPTFSSPTATTSLFVTCSPWPHTAS